MASWAPRPIHERHPSLEFDGSSGSKGRSTIVKMPNLASRLDLQSGLMRFFCLSILLIAGCAERLGSGPQSLSKPSPRIEPTQAHEPGEPDDIDQLSQHFERTRPVQTLRGKATYYSSSLAGHRMASGERYDPNRAQAAHRTLPFGTIVRVTNVHSNESVVVRIVQPRSLWTQGTNHRSVVFGGAQNRARPSWSRGGSR